MQGNSFGKAFTLTSFGESHGPAVGGIIDGCPAGVTIDEELIYKALARRAPGQSPYTSPRKEKDRVQILSGVFKGKSTGAPICLLIENKDADSSKYKDMAQIYRPGHANLSYLTKYGIFDYRGGGRASARETAVRVAAGAVAKAFLQELNMDIFAFISQVGKVKYEPWDFWQEKTEDEAGQDNFKQCESEQGKAGQTKGAEDRAGQRRGKENKTILNKPDQDYKTNDDYIKELENFSSKSPLFAPDKQMEKAIALEIEEAQKQKDSVGGVVSFFINKPPTGLGEPLYGKLNALLALALMGIPASKGFEIGRGFESAAYRGSDFNDGFRNTTQGVRLKSNRAGGVLGGISTGDLIYGRLAFKPTPSIGISQKSLDIHGQEVDFTLPQGSRHDPCLALRAVPVVEAMCWLVMADLYLQNKGSRL